ncbi:MAG: Flp pilus assembly complex ATPase component TadA [Actinobacteria bacterium]|jgi:pilus assembly protein CpaF|nr:CpaF family protein [Chloroflexota bacterium]MBU2562962.1 Flp pilus assembly complex ATPase component TadA [Actinomycetota bacterium]MBU4314028.1 Flp pilus assembly complex ATPase component TadA [Actinomycetota bacterium]
MLRDRICDQNKLTKDDEKEIISLIKKKIKNDDFFVNSSFFNRDDFKGKLYLLLKDEIEKKYPYSDFDVEDNLINKALSEIFGLGILEKFLQDRMVTDIFIQDNEMIIIKNGIKEYLGTVFNSLDEVYLIIDRIKSNTGKTVDQRVPFLNTVLYDGSRCSIVIPPISDRVYISIRVFNCIDFELEDLLRLNMFNKKDYDILKDLVDKKKNILIAGSMGSGKTTLLNTLVKLIPKNEFINIIQDVPEIKLKEHPFVRMLCTRTKSRESDNEINQDRLVFETLRMKADRIIVGEVRDSMAAYQMLQALNTGHRGSFSTIHADSAFDAFLKLETLAMEYKTNISNYVVKQMISRAIDVVLFLDYEKDEDFNICNRRLKELLLVDNNLSKRGDYKLEYL